MSTTTTKAGRKAAPVSTEEEKDFLPASCGLPREVHEKITEVAEDNERSFAAQLRMIAKEWAAKQGGRS